MLNIFDIGIILMFIMFMIVGWKNGVIKELVGFIGMVIVFIISFMLKGVVGNILCYLCPFTKFGGYIKGFTVLNIFLYQALGFFLVFSLLLCIYRIILKLSKTLQKIVNYTIVLLLPSKLGGALIGLIEGWIITFMILVVLMVPFKGEEVFKESHMVNMVLFDTPVLSNSIKPFSKSVSEIYDLSSKISMEELEMNEANLQSLDIMLKYKVVNKKTVENLVKMHKLDDIKNINSVLRKY